MPSGQWILTGTALGFAILVTNALAQTNPDPAAIEALIPVPEPADVPPPTLRDIGPIPSPVTSEQPAAQPSTAPADRPLVTPAPASPAGGLAEIDRAVADSIKGLIERKLTTYLKNTREQDGVRVFYTSREFAPLWIENGAINARATAAAAFLATVAGDGLDPADYPSPSPRKGASTEDLADAELRLTHTVLEFARHAQTGRVHFSRVSADILYPVVYPDVVDVLTKMSQAQDVAAVLASHYPRHEGYRALRAKLAELRKSGPATVRGGRNQIDVIIANMERWRWLPRDLGTVYSMLNIPDFTLKVVRNRSVIWRTKVVVGKPTTPTPLLTETMKYITVNPTWNVPPSIVNKEYLPALQRDPTVLQRMGIRIARNPDGGLRMYQPPGERNALGRIRFNFPNKFLVYQHDTPTKNLFARAQRAYSHGCMRVQDPDKYAEILLSVARPKDGYTADRVRRMFGGPERQINFVQPIPVHITYQTAFVDESGTLQIRNDLYGRDTRTLAALKGDDRRLVNVRTERRKRVSTRRPAPPRFGLPRQDPGFFLFGPVFR